MLALIFKVGEQPFAINTDCIVEILPALKLQHVHDTSEAIAGLFNYQGQIVPVININQIFDEPPSSNSKNLQQRIILMRQTTTENKEKIFGLLVENILETTSIAKTELNSDETLSELFQKPYLGETFLKQNHILQRLLTENILSDQEYHELISDVELNDQLTK